MTKTVIPHKRAASNAADHMAAKLSPPTTENHEVADLVNDLDATLAETHGLMDDLLKRFDDVLSFNEPTTATAVALAGGRSPLATRLKTVADLLRAHNDQLRGMLDRCTL